MSLTQLFVAFRCDCCGRVTTGLPRYVAGLLSCGACASGRHDHPRATG